MKVGTTAIALVIATVLVGAAPLTAFAQTGTATMTSAPGKVKATQTIKMYATVVSINYSYREVQLMDENGKLHDITVSDDVRNFDQVKVGDKLNIEYTEAISIQLKKRGTATPGAMEQQAMVRAPKGAKPGGAVGRQVTAIATVVAIDAKKQEVTLKGAQGNEYDLSVTDPAQLKLVKKGDEVGVTYTEALAISVESTPNSQR